MLTRKDLIAPEYVQNYIALVKDDHVLQAISRNTKAFNKLLEKIPRNKIDYSYAEGKWTIREVVQHIIDTERVFSYRAVSFSRGDETPLPGFDQDLWATHSGAAGRKWKDLRKEFATLRESNEYLFASLSEEQLLKAGKASNYDINVLAIGFLLPGHIEHHIKILKEKYL